MKIKRKIWALLLSAAIMVTFMPAAAFADDQAAPESAEAVETMEAAVEAEAAKNADAAEESKAVTNEPVSAKYAGAPLRGVINTDRVLGLEDPAPGGNGFVVTFSDGSEKTFAWTETDRFPEGAFACDDNTYLFAKVNEEDGAAVSFDDGWNNDVELLLKVYYTVDGEEHEKDLTTKTNVICAYDHKPLELSFVPADGFKLECYAGPNYLTEDMFFGEGNEFVLKAEGWNDLEGAYMQFNNHYKYVETKNEDGDTVGAFALNGNPERYGEFYLDEGVPCDFELGEEDNVEFSYTEFVEELDEFVTVKVSVPVKATKIMPYVYTSEYSYTGKVITPAFKVYDHRDNLIDPSEYTVEAPAAKKIGWYEAKIKFKDTEKYVDSIDAYYSIGPYTPKLTKVTAGKKKLTVRWKKMSAKQLKYASGFYIEVSTDSDFAEIVKTVKVSKKAFKAKKKTIRGLKKGKKYYVRMYAYKTVTQDGEKQTVQSAYSKVLSKKAK